MAKTRSVIHDTGQYRTGRMPSLTTDFALASPFQMEVRLWTGGLLELRLEFSGSSATVEIPRRDG